MTEQEKDALMENLHFMNNIKGYMQFEFFRISGMDPDRISFLYNDDLIASKRYERFEKKKIAELHEYFKTRCPLLHAEELENSVMEYIINIITLPNEIGAYAFKSAIAESKENREFIRSLLESSIGMKEDPFREEFEVIDYNKVVGFLTHIKNDSRKAIRNALCSKAFYEKEICESNYTLRTEFSDTEKDLMLSNIISNAIVYIILQSDADVTPSALDYQGLQIHKNAQIDTLLQMVERLEKENERLTKRLKKKTALKSTKTTKTVKINNPETAKENKKLKQEINELKTIVSELEDIIAMSEGSEEVAEDVIRDVRNDKILFVGGHENELRKLKFIFQNSECFNKCSTDIQANYVQKFDYIVFFAHYSSHSLYHKVKGIADQMNVPYIHCEYNNPKIIAEYIANHIPETIY